MPAPKSPLTTLRDALAAAQPLTAIRAQVLLGKKALPRSGKPPRVVLVPVKVEYDSPYFQSQTVSVRDAWLTIGVHLWGANLDEVIDLETRFFQAMKIQAEGDAADPNGAGLFWRTGSGDWVPEDTDTNKEGEVIAPLIQVIYALAPPALGVGPVDEVKLLDPDDSTMPVVDILPDP
jgi:hypothetical protein